MGGGGADDVESRFIELCSSRLSQRAFSESRGSRSINVIIHGGKSEINGDASESFSHTRGVSPPHRRRSCVEGALLLLLLLFFAVFPGEENWVTTLRLSYISSVLTNPRKKGNVSKTPCLWVLLVTM